MAELSTRERKRGRETRGTRTFFFAVLSAKCFSSSFSCVSSHYAARSRTPSEYSVRGNKELEKSASKTTTMSDDFFPTLRVLMGIHLKLSDHCIIFKFDLCPKRFLHFFTKIFVSGKTLIIIASIFPTLRLINNNYYQISFLFLRKNRKQQNYEKKMKGITNFTEWDYFQHVVVLLVNDISLVPFSPFISSTLYHCVWCSTARCLYVQWKDCNSSWIWKYIHTLRKEKEMQDGKCEKSSPKNL